MFPRHETLTATACAVLLAVTAIAPGSTAQKAQTVVYIADQDVEDQLELFAVDLDTLDVTQVNEPMIADGDVYALWQHVYVDRKGRHVFYIADAHVDGTEELFHADLKTGTTSKVNVPLVAGGQVRSGYRVDDKVRTVVYSADAEIDGVQELYRHDMKSGVSTKLGADASEVLLDRKGRRAFYVSESSGELRVTDLKKGESRSLSGPMVDGAAIHTVQLGKRGAYAVYTADQDGVREIHRVKAKKGEPTTLNGSLAAGVDVGAWFAMDAKGRRIVYATDDVTTDGLDALYYAKKPGKPLGVSVDVGWTGMVEDDFVVGPKGRVVVYRARVGSGMPTELYVSSSKTGETTKLNAPLEQGGHVESFLVGPKGKHVVYETYVDSTREIHLVELKSGEVTKLNGALVEGGDVDDFVFGPKGRYVVYLADQEKQYRTELYHVDLETGERTKLNPELGDGGRVLHDFRIGPRGRHVFYRARQATDDAYELYAVELKTGEVTKLSAPMVEGGHVRMFLVSGLREQDDWL